MEISSQLLANSYSAFSPLFNITAAICNVNGQQVACPDFSGIFGAAFGVFFMLFQIIFWAIILIIIIGQWKIYVKAGQPGWAAIIPVYNVIVLLEIIKKPIWWVILMFIPIVNVVISFIVYYELAKAFGKGTGFAIGMLLLPFIFIPILGFGNAQYVGGSTENTTPSPTPQPQM